MQQIISVIVPVYQVDNYLGRCIESLLCQTYHNLEIFLVDDGSCDTCARISDAWAKKDDRIRAIHKKNGGLSDARNAGMPFATGKYISFIDSDDTVTPDYFEVMLHTLQTEKSDIIECGVVKFYEDNHFDAFQDDLSVTSYSAVDGLSGLINENSFHQHVWNKLYKAELVLDVPFPFGKLNEDEFWTYQIFGRAKQVTKINKTMYHYFQRGNSIMGESFNLRRLDALEGKYNRQQYIEKYYPTLASQARIDLFSSCIFSGQSTLKYLRNLEKEQAISKINQYVKGCKLSQSELNSIQGKNRFWYSFADKSFWLCCKVRSVTGIGF